MMMMNLTVVCDAPTGSVFDLARRITPEPSPPNTNVWAHLHRCLRRLVVSAPTRTVLVVKGFALNPQHNTNVWAHLHRCLRRLVVSAPTRTVLVVKGFALNPQHNTNVWAHLHRRLRRLVVGARRRRRVGGRGGCRCKGFR
jgi:DNA/RNA endonuclease G (NUC1)